MADNKASASTDAKSNTAVVADHAPIVIDLGTQRRKKVKRLLKGGGSLFGEVQSAVQELREAGKIKQGVQLVFVNVQKKRRKRDLNHCGLGLLG